MKDSVVELKVPVSPIRPFLQVVDNMCVFERIQNGYNLNSRDHGKYQLSD